MKTISFLFTMFLVECFSDSRVYLIETEDGEDNTSGGISEDEAGKPRGTKPQSSKESLIKAIL